MTSTAATPAPIDPDVELDAQIESVLHDGVLAGHLPAVQALRRSLEVSRGLCALGVVAGPQSPATPSRPRQPRQSRPRFDQPRCAHSHPEKGPCRREPHPGAPRAHAYGQKVTRSTRPVPATFDERASA